MRLVRYCPVFLLSWLIGILVLAAGGRAWAGPNAGGMLVVHDVGLAYTDDGGYPWPSVTPTCAGVDNELPTGQPPNGSGYVWKVYAAFPLASSPRLKALSFGAVFPSSTTVLAGGVVHDSDFELPTAGWPWLSGYGVMMSFGQVQTDHVVECYWLAGYGASGTWRLASHPSTLIMFVDDAWPPIEDQIMGLSTIGFGEPGATYCPDGVHIGACCQPDGGCQVLEESACAAVGGIFRGVGFACDPDPCYAGACCLPSGQCFFTTEDECQTAGLFVGRLIPCDPFPCPGPVACCVIGSCLLMPAWNCVGYGGIPYPDQPSCDPNPCPIGGACCLPDGITCRDFMQVQCEEQGGVFHPGAFCNVDPCGFRGACCLPNNSCVIYFENACAAHEGRFLGPGTSCTPDPCSLDGACCLPDGSCLLLTGEQCAAHGGRWFGVGSACAPDPCGLDGACCFPDGTCLVLSAEACGAQQGGWIGPGSVCTPNPCVPTPVEVTTWGRIKNRYR